MIDTIQIKISARDVNEDNLELLLTKYRPIININKSRELTSGTITLVLKRYINQTTSLQEYNYFLQAINKILKGQIKLQRFDLSIDLNEQVETHKELFYLFQASLSYIRMHNLNDIFSTTKGNSIVNCKIKNGIKWETTIYDHTDKPNRFGKARLENRFLSIRKTYTGSNIIAEKIKEYNNELDALIANISKVENSMVDNLYKLWLAEKHKHHNIKAFIDNQDLKGRICTRNILDQLLKKMDYDGETESFIKNFRRGVENRLNFVSKGDFENLVVKIKRENRKTLA